MKIFPKEIIENSSEVFKFKHTTNSKIIYTILLATILAIIIALPFIKVDIYTSAAGLIKPDIERVPISLINSGRVKYSLLKDNLEVTKGDTLLIIENKIIDEQLTYSNNQSNEVKEFIQDLSYLISAQNPRLSNLRSGKYRAAFLEYNQNSKELKARLQQKESNYNRNKVLYEKGIIASAEFERIESEFKIAESNLISLQKQMASNWQVDLLNYGDVLEELESNKNQLIENKSQFYVTSPESGTLLNTAQFRPGSFISQGIQLAEISPSTDLIVECYISPSDIGLINSENKVIFQVDAYNYNQWGLANGNITEISRDIIMIDQQPVFIVRCRINEKFLQLKNGVAGEIKKGMTVNARFLLTERSLYNLLYDNVNDWLNPATT